MVRETPSNAELRGDPQDPEQRAAEERSAKPEQCGAEEDSQYPSSTELRHNPQYPNSAHRGDQWHTVGTGAGPFPLLSDPPRSVSPESFSLGLSALVCLPPVP